MLWYKWQMHKGRQGGQMVIVQLKGPLVWRGTHPSSVPLSKTLNLCNVFNSSPWPLTSVINTLLVTYEVFFTKSFLFGTSVVWFNHMHNNTEVLRPKEENKRVNMECLKLIQNYVLSSDRPYNNNSWIFSYKGSHTFKGRAGLLLVTLNYYIYNNHHHFY